MIAIFDAVGVCEVQLRIARGVQKGMLAEGELGVVRWAILKSHWRLRPAGHWGQKVGQIEDSASCFMDVNRQRFD
jgi:hypothetical protein